MGRPPTKPKKLRDGFYIEVRNKRSNSGVKVRRDTEAQMKQAIREYQRSKDIIILGEYKDGKPINDPVKFTEEQVEIVEKEEIDEEIEGLDEEDSIEELKDDDD
jgi:flagellar biosynthesis/type III secretory pathway ATPase